MLMARNRPVCHRGSELFVRDEDSRTGPLTERQLRGNDCDRLHIARRTAAPDTYDAKRCLQAISGAIRACEFEKGGTGGRQTCVEPACTCQEPVESGPVAGDQSVEQQKTVERITAVWDEQCVSDPCEVTVPTTECAQGGPMVQDARIRTNASQRRRARSWTGVVVVQ